MSLALSRLGALAGAVLALALALASPASALQLLSPSGDPTVARFQTWVDAAAVPTPPVSLNVVLATCPVPISDGCIVHDPVATVYLGPFVRDRATLLHEVGHAFDASTMTDADRGAFEAIFKDRRPWRSPANSPHERFAEAYSLCARRPVIRKAYTGAYGYRVTPAQQRRVCALIRRAG